MVLVRESMWKAGGDMRFGWGREGVGMSLGSEGGRRGAEAGGRLEPE